MNVFSVSYEFPLSAPPADRKMKTVTVEADSEAHAIYSAWVQNNPTATAKLVSSPEVTPQLLKEGKSYTREAYNHDLVAWILNAAQWCTVASLLPEATDKFGDIVTPQGKRVFNQGTFDPLFCLFGPQSLVERKKLIFRFSQEKRSLYQFKDRAKASESEMEQFKASLIQAVVDKKQRIISAYEQEIPILEQQLLQIESGDF